MNRVFYLLEEIVILATLLSFLNIVSSTVSRINSYFDFFYILAVPYIFNKRVNFKLKEVNLNRIIMYGYLIIYWMIFYGWMRAGETVPFIFMRS